MTELPRGQLATTWVKEFPFNCAVLSYWYRILGFNLLILPEAYYSITFESPCNIAVARHFETP
jgi:hypothetical protein